MVLVGTNYAAASIIVRRRKGQLQFLVMDTERFRGKNAGVKLVQFPMESAELQDYGNPQRTLEAALEEEVGLRIRASANPEILHSETTPEGHVKIFFLIWRSHCRGNIRTKPIRDTRSDLGVPYWVGIEGLKERLCETHRVALPKLEFLAVRPLTS